MMRYALLLFLIAADVYGQAPAPPAPVVVLPVLPSPPSPAPAPAPKPAPGTPVLLASDTLYVATAKEDCLLIVSTTDAGKQSAEIVRVTTLIGPVTFALTKFVDGDGKRETRAYKAGFIWTLEAVGPGTVEVLFVPKGATSSNVVVRQLITTNTAPQPPPEPPAPPKPPEPTPTPAPIPLAGFRVLIQYDPATRTDAQDGILNGAKVRAYLQSHCVVGEDGKTKDFWILQKGLDVSAAPKWIGDVIQRHPGQPTFMVVSDGKTGYDGPLPANADEALKILQKVGGQ